MIKNIIFDIDGVLTNLDHCYYNFLKATYEEHRELKYEDLPVIYPIDADDGAFELPSQFSEDFYNSPFYCDRPFFSDTLKVLTSLKKKGIKLFTLSAAGNPAKKRKWVESIFIDIFESFEFSSAGVPKDEALIEVIEKHAMDRNETIFIDDRFFNIKAGIRAGVTTVRKQPEFFLPLPKELSGIKVCKSLVEFEEYVDELNK